MTEDGSFETPPGAAPQDERAMFAALVREAVGSFLAGAIEAGASLEEFRKAAAGVLRAELAAVKGKGQRGAAA